MPIGVFRSTHRHMGTCGATWKIADIHPDTARRLEKCGEFTRLRALAAAIDALEDDEKALCTAIHQHVCFRRQIAMSRPVEPSWQRQWCHNA